MSLYRVRVKAGVTNVFRIDGQPDEPRIGEFDLNFTGTIVVEAPDEVAAKEIALDFLETDDADHANGPVLVMNDGEGVEFEALYAVPAEVNELGDEEAANLKAKVDAASLERKLVIAFLRTLSDRTHDDAGRRAFAFAADQIEASRHDVVSA